MSAVAPPLSLLLELTHRCPLACPYCSNPLQLASIREELDTATWLDAIDQAAEMGVLQVHFSGGEPTLRKDLAELIRRTRGHGLYSNLITSGVALDEAGLDRLIEAGLEHVQLSIQGASAETADVYAGYRNSHEKKLRFAGWMHARELPLTLNAVIHRHNIEQIPRIIELALEVGARRLEVAHTQYYGWGLRNRAALMPSPAQVQAATAAVEAARERLRGQLVIDYVIPDYYGELPKACMGGWGQRFVNIGPRGDVMPCHAADVIPGLRFDNIRERGLREIWEQGEAFARFRGTAWMPEPCKSCEWREVDWGGCRCQALALSGRADVTDPVCRHSPDHARIRAMAEAESTSAPPEFVYRRPAKAPAPKENTQAMETS